MTGKHSEPLHRCRDEKCQRLAFVLGERGIDLRDDVIEDYPRAGVEFLHAFRNERVVIGQRPEFRKQPRRFLGADILEDQRADFLKPLFGTRLCFVDDGLELDFVTADHSIKQFPDEILLGREIVSEVAQLHVARGRNAAHAHGAIAVFDKQGERRAQNRFMTFATARIAALAFANEQVRDRKLGRTGIGHRRRMARIRAECKFLSIVQIRTLDKFTRSADFAETQGITSAGKGADMAKRTMLMALATSAMMISHPVGAQSFDTPLPEEALSAVAVLPEAYPPSWVIVSDFNFNAIIDGRGVVVDTTSENMPLKGMFRASQFASILPATTRPEIYTAETFYSRLSEGERTDAITIWDKATLKSKGEIILPGNKRQQVVTYKNTFQFTNAEKWALITNFTPAHSVTVVDLDGRKVLGEIELPGCSMVYPTGERGFTTFCADGTLTSITLDPAGKVASTTTTKPIHDIDKQAMFAMPAMVGRTAWFVTYHGMVRGFDLSGPVVKALNADFSVGAAEGGAPEWRPGGWQVITSDAAGRLYVLMSAAGREGSHKDGGTEVWVLDPAKKARVARIALKGTGASIEVTKEAVPHLIVARGDSVIDVYDAASGAFVRTLGRSVAFNPLTLTAM